MGGSSQHGMSSQEKIVVQISAQYRSNYEFPDKMWELTTQHNNVDVGWGKKRDGATTGRTDGGTRELILGVGLDDMKDASQ